MKKYLVLFTLIMAFGARAEVPSAEKLLPNDTIFMLSAPSGLKLKSVFKASPQGQLWDDPAMRPFREDFNKKFNTEFLAPVEKELGIKLADYQELAQGQVTMAVTQNGWTGKPEEKLGFIMLVDTQTKSGQLKTNLADLKKRWTETGKQIKTEKIHDIEFTTIITSNEEMGKSLRNIFPAGEEPAGETNKIEITIGQADTLLLVGNSPKVIEKILIRLSGGLVPGLSEDPVYENNHNAHFRNAQIYAWLNPKSLLDVWKGTPVDSADPFAPKPEKIMTSLGLSGLKSLAFAFVDAPEGGTVKFILGAPESGRLGLLKLLTPEPKDAGPLPYVPSDTAKFSRWRIDLQKTFNGIEAMVTEISPAAAGVFKMVMDSAGKDQDPNFDLRKELFGNLGNDLISIQKAPRSSTLEDINSPPTVYLIGSANPDKLAHALKVALSSLGQEAFKEREFLGRKVYSLTMSGAAFGAADAKPKSFHFSSSGGYFASSGDVALLEEFLRSSEFKGKPLSQEAGFADAVQKIGGLSTGLFGYESQREQARVAFEALKKDPKVADALFGLGSGNGAEGENKSNKWADFSLLPAFDSVSKYFHFSVYAGSFDANGFTLNLFSPTPPQLKK